MLIEQIWTANRLRNFNYLIACKETGEALVVDPLATDLCLQLAENRGWEIRTVVNTHEHGDHTGGNRAIVRATGASVCAHHAAADVIPEMTRGLRAGDTIKVGTSVTLRVLDTPGHTMSHVCLLAESNEAPALLCGDTLFNAGAGNCHNGGHPNELYATFTSQLAQLPEATRIYPGHDYLVNNLKFTLDREPGNRDAKTLLEACEQHDPTRSRVTTLEEEKRINTFFRLHNPEIIERLRDRFPELGSRPDAREVFLALRALRNDW